jgi:hypothetical protein
VVSAWLIAPRSCEDRVRDVIRNFNADGFSSLYPKYKGGRPPKFTLGQRREIKKIARSHAADHGLPFSTWSLSKLADFLVAEAVVEDISHEGLPFRLRAPPLESSAVCSCYQVGWADRVALAASTGTPADPGRVSVVLPGGPGWLS